VSSSRPGRADDKDAADVYRLMQTTRPADVAERMAQLRGDPLAGDVTATAIAQLDALFGRRGSPGILTAVRALRLAVPREEVVAVATAYVRTLRGILGARA
jgi:hypothetical protein